MDTSRDYRKAYADLVAYCSKAQHIVIFGHRGPDGDSVGSTMALKLLLEAWGKRVDVIMSGSLPQNLSWLSGVHSILRQSRQEEEIQSILSSCDLMICLDFNALHRLGSELRDLVVLQRSQREFPLLMIDHHPDPSDEFDWQWSCPEAAATCEVLTRLFLDADERWIDIADHTVDSGTSPLEGQALVQRRSAIATALLVGIITDTGLFNHNASSPELYELVAVLLRSGADKERAVNRIFHAHPESRQRMEGYILYERVVLLPEIQSAYFVLTKADFERFNLAIADTDGFVNMPLDINGVNCSAFFRETPDDGVKISVRSIGNIAVNDLCQECFGGGGHKNAAGGEFSEGSIGDAVDRFVDYMQRHYAIDTRKKQTSPRGGGIPIPKELLEL